MSTPTIDQRCAAQAHAESQTYYFECPYLLTPDELRSVLTELAALREDKALLLWALNHPELFCEAIQTVAWGPNAEANFAAARAAIDAARKEGIK